VVRLLRVVNHFHGLRRIVATFFIALPTIGNALLLVTLFLFIFSVLGCQLFYGERPWLPLALAALDAKHWPGTEAPCLCYALLLKSSMKVHYAAAAACCRRCCCCAAGIMPLKPAGMTMFLNWNNVGNSMMMLTVAATGEACCCCCCSARL
jgi:hypothetical protein